MRKDAWKDGQLRCVKHLHYGRYADHTNLQPTVARDRAQLSLRVVALLRDATGAHYQNVDTPRDSRRGQRGSPSLAHAAMHQNEAASLETPLDTAR